MMQTCSIVVDIIPFIVLIWVADEILGLKRRVDELEARGER